MLYYTHCKMELSANISYLRVQENCEWPKHSLVEKQVKWTNIKLYNKAIKKYLYMLIKERLPRQIFEVKGTKNRKQWDFFLYKYTCRHAFI